MFTPESRTRVRELLLDRAAADPAIVGAATTGSTAAGAEDRWSDIDLFLGTDPLVDVSSIVADWTSWMRPELGVVGHFDLLGAGATYRAFLLDTGLEVDLGFAPGPAFRRTGGEAFTVLFGDPAPALPTQTPDTGHLTGLAWHHVLHSRTAIERGRPWSAEYWISALRGLVLTLACARLGLPTTHGKGFDALPTVVTDPLRAAIPHSLKHTALVSALQASTTALLTELRGLSVEPGLQTTLRDLADLPARSGDPSR